MFVLKLPSKDILEQLIYNCINKKKKYKNYTQFSLNVGR